ncbi:MAG: helix-turn-helix domain-containing protein [Cellulomonadaceae bacterium]|nr:helix-turn-helix domain-containing protein [Cellulomonadaceae bacterium]
MPNTHTRTLPVVSPPPPHQHPLTHQIGCSRWSKVTTLDALCQALDCQPGDLLRWQPDSEPT